MYHVSAHSGDERMINVHYYCYSHRDKKNTIIISRRVI